MAAGKTVRVCRDGHRYEKSSDCPTCPVCEAERKPESGLLSTLSAPARRALERQGIVTVDHLAKFTETEILALHGIGPSSMPRLKAALAKSRRAFRTP